MVAWTQVKTASSDTEFDDYRDEGMCCSAIFFTQKRSRCLVCIGDHAMVERRLQCRSGTCEDHGKGKVMWKAWQCSARGVWQIVVNDSSHTRGAVPCLVTLQPKLTVAMREFVCHQDECGVPPRVILANMKKQRDIPVTRRGWPTPSQLHNFLKRTRRDMGAKNSIKSIRELVRLRGYNTSLASNTAFVFGSSLDSEGYAYVGSGEDDDPFILGVTSMELLDNALKYGSPDRCAIFHADATFKLSDIGYPVIACGFTNRARSYQLAAMFVVSQRTVNEYTQCFRSLARLVKDVFGRLLSVQLAIGDAEDVQFSAVQNVSEFTSAKILMCFFHVLCNVRKKTRHLCGADRKMLMRSIMDMHFCKSAHDLFVCRDRELVSWRKLPHLKVFADYFQNQWLSGRYWRWQIYHTPGAYAATNNPSEVFNASVKRFTQRKRFHMRLLLTKLCDIVETTTPAPPVASDYVPAPTPDLVAAAKNVLERQRVVVKDTDCQRSKLSGIQTVSDPDCHISDPDCHVSDPDC